MKCKLHSVFATTFILLFLVACSVELPSHVISQGRMERILYDYHIAQSMAEAQGGDVEANRYLYVQKVFEKHRVTEAQFDTSMVWYSGHASYLSEMYAHIDARLARESEEAGLNIPEDQKYARFTAEGDTANIWQGRDMMFLHGNREENIYSLHLIADTSYHEGDYFMLRFSNLFVTKDFRREAFALFSLCYDNDSTVATSIMISGNNDAVLSIPEDRLLTGHKVKSLSCTFYLSFDEVQEPSFRLWVISKPVLLRYHQLKLSEETAEIEDSLQYADTLATDTLHPSGRQQGGERISPEQFRSNQQVERKINVVEKRRVVLPAKNSPKRKAR